MVTTPSENSMLRKVPVLMLLKKEPPQLEKVQLDQMVLLHQPKEPLNQRQRLKKKRTTRRLWTSTLLNKLPSELKLEQRRKLVPLLLLIWTL